MKKSSIVWLALKFKEGAPFNEYMFQEYALGKGQTRNQVRNSPYSPLLT